MASILQDFCPYERSRLWELHHAYYARTGADVWLKGQVPYQATSNRSMARQQAKVLTALVEDLEATGVLAPDAEIVVLEVGGGLGVFAANLMTALEKHCGVGGRAVLARLRYVFSDFSAKGVGEAVARAPLEEYVRRGRVVPALLDLRAPEEITQLDGSSLRGRFVAVFSNYVCCALPPVRLQKRREGIFQKFVQVAFPDGDGRPAEELWRDLLGKADQPGAMEALEIAGVWRPVDPRSAFSDPIHAAVFEEVTGRFKEATVAYPQVWFDFARKLAPRMVPGGALLVADFGEGSVKSLEGRQERRPRIYGNSFNQPINFGMFDAFARVTELTVLRPRNPWQLIQRAALVYGGRADPAWRSAFRRSYLAPEFVGERGALELAAQAMTKAGGHQTAARIYRALIRREPASAELHFHLGEACFESAWYSLAVRYLRRGRRLDVKQELDFDFKLGCAYFGLFRYREARQAFRRALKQKRHPTTYGNLAVVYEHLGKLARARSCYQRALALVSTGPESDFIRAKLAVLESSGSVTL